VIRRALFRTIGADLPPEVVLMLRVLAVAWLVTGHAFFVPLRMVPMFELLAPITRSPVLGYFIFVLDVACTLHIVFGRSVRASSLALGVLIFATTLLSRGYFSNNRLFCACLFTIGALEGEDRPPILVRAQVILVYALAGLDKLLDSDWRSGIFFDSFSVRLAEFGRLWSPALDTGSVSWPAVFYADLARELPPLFLARASSWLTIALELSIAALLAAGRVRIGVVLAIAFHTGVVVLTGSPMGMFFYAGLASCLAFARFPSRLEIAMEPESLAGRAIRFFDADDRFELSTGSRLPASWLAIVIYSPAAYVVAAVLFAGPWFTPWAAIVLLALAIMFRPSRAPALRGAP
jgi:hypothetical protein